MPFKGIVFDLDGVLIDSGPVHERAFLSVFSKLGIQGFSYSQYAGWCTEDVIKDVLRKSGRPGRDDEVAQLAAEKRAAAAAAMQDAAKLGPKRCEVLRALGQRFRLGLASSASRRHVRTFIELNGCESIFRSVLSCEDVGRAKPCPDIYLKAFAELEVKPWEALVVEDSVAGVRAGKLAGAVVVGITGTSSAKQLEDAGADAVLNSIDTLPQWLDNHSSSITGGVIERGALDRHAARSVFTELWTGIVPAAGRGTRLNYREPKILYRILGKSILQRLLELLRPNCARIVIVVSREGRPLIEKEAEAIEGTLVETVVQPEPTGMAEAVKIGLMRVETVHTIVVWGDQAGLRAETINWCMRIHQGWLAPSATLPTVLLPHPYVHLQRSEGGDIEQVLQSREGDCMPAYGESDCGVFCFRTEILRKFLEDPRWITWARGAKTGETNLLPLLPKLALEAGGILTPRIARPEECVGINTVEDARRLEGFLKDLGG